MYEWRDHKNAVGFSAECARAALPFYKGDQRDDVVKAIEIAEACSHGESVDKGRAYVAICIMYGVGNAFKPACYVAYAAANAIHAGIQCTESDPGSVAPRVTFASNHAMNAGVTQETIDKLYAQWVVYDLGGAPDTEIGRAMFALIAIGAYDEAANLLEENAA